MLMKANFLRNILQRRYISYIFQMDKAYLRQCDDGDHFEFSFEYKQENPKISRKFNFSRNLSETLDTFLTRISANVEKAINKKSKKTSMDNVSNKLYTALLHNNIEVARNKICQDVFVPNCDIVLSIKDKQFNVIINSPWVETLGLSSSILAQFPTYPVKFQALFTDKQLSEFIWYKSKDKIKWEQVGDQYIYTPSNLDIDHFLKLSCIPKNEELTGPIIECISVCKVQASPGDCPFDKRHAFTKKKASDKEFRVVTYNLLADLYSDSDYSREVLFPYCPAYALNIDYRKQLFLKEIVGYNADLICLQEVDRNIFNYDLQPTLAYLGYESCFYLKGGEVAEGLAFFYNKQRFILLDSEQFIFAKRIDQEPLFSDIWDRIQTNAALVERIKAKTTTLQINVLGSLEHNEVLVVANTHLYFHPDADHIRLLHGCCAIKYLEHIVNKAKERYGKRVSLIFCGDFNSVPECGIYKLYTTGFIPRNFIDYSSNDNEKIESIDVEQPFKLGSACGTPKYTNFTAGFADCLDYIFYERTNLDVVQMIPLPTVEELNQNTAIPSIVFPSDHIALVSDLKWL